MESTMYGRMATQIPYVVMYGIADKASTTAIPEIMSEAKNHPFMEHEASWSHPWRYARAYPFGKSPRPASAPC